MPPALLDTGEIEILARAVIVIRGRVLLAHSKGARNTFLPGGHIERGESARAALARELTEELGVRARIGSFVGAVEHGFTQKGRRVHEVNLLFDAAAPGLGASRNPVSRESHVEFFWCPIAKLGARKLEPAPLRRLLPQWLNDKSRSAWASTFER